MVTADQLPIKPKRWRMVKYNGRKLLAVIMPYPSLTGHEPCAHDERFTADRQHVSPAALYCEERELARICSTCPTLIACREYAIAHDRWNFMGGMSAQDRQAERINRGQAAVEPHSAASVGLDASHYYTPPETCPHGHELSTNTALWRRQGDRLLPICTVCFDIARTTRKRAAS